MTYQPHDLRFLTPRQLEILSDLATTGSVTETAKNLGITHQAVVDARTRAAARIERQSSGRSRSPEAGMALLLDVLWEPNAIDLIEEANETLASQG